MAVAIAGLVVSSEAQAWTEAEVLAMALAEAPDVTNAEARIARSVALVEAAGLYPDPELRWSREALVDGAAPSQDVVALSVPVDLSGRRRAQRSLAEVLAVSSEAEAVDARSRVAAAALTAFYEGLAADARAVVARRAVEALDEAVRVIRSREAQGTAAGMDQMRITLEVELARSQLATSEVAARLARAQLLVLLGRAAPAGGEGPSLEGTLAVEAVPALAAVIAEAADQPSVAARRRANALSGSAEDSARSAWIPPLYLTGGLNIERETNTRVGYVAGVAFGLPLFNQGRRVAAAARAQSFVTEAELDARTRQAQAAVLAAHTRLVGMHEEAVRFEAATEGTLEGLLIAANSGYREGRRTLVELLDARRAAVAVAVRRVDLQLEARRAEVALRMATGALQ